MHFTRFLFTILLIALFRPTVATPMDKPTDIIFYFNKSAQHHQQQFDRLYKQNYRILSVNVSGTVKDPRYACVWIKEKDWTPFHAFSVKGVAAYQAKFDEWVGKGYAPAILSATGPSPKEAIFTGTFVQQKNAVVPFTRSELNAKGLREAIELARKKDWIPIWVNAYGSASKPYYTCIFARNHRKVSWELTLEETADQLQARYEAHRYNRVRPTFYAIGPANRYLSIYQNDEIGWFDYAIGLTAQGLTAKLQGAGAKNFFPIRIEAYGVGAATRYTVLLTRSLNPAPRRFVKTGHATPFTASIDEYVEGMMTRYNIKAASIAIAYKGRLVHARGYTYAESGGYPVTQPTDRFRVASLSKSLVSIAVHKIMEDSGGKLTYNTRASTFFGPFEDERFRNVTLGELLSHSSALKSKLGDPYPFVGPNEQANAAHLLTWNAAQENLFMPNYERERGTFNYCNKGYWLLGRFVAKMGPHGNHEAAMRKYVFNPLGLREPALAWYDKRDREVLYQHEFLRLRTNLREGRGLAPVAYQAIHYNLYEGSGGWSLSAPDYVRILAAFHSNVNNPLMSPTYEQKMLSRAPSGGNQAYGWTVSTTNNRRVTVHSKGGLLPSIVETQAVNRSDDISFVVFVNRPGSRVVNQICEEIHKLANTSAPADWPGINFFPLVGLEAF